MEKSCLRWRNSGISGSCSQVRERRSERLTGGSLKPLQLYSWCTSDRELSRKGKLSIYQPVYAPPLTYGHELCVMTERTRLRTQGAKMSFLHTLTDSSLITPEKLGVVPLLHVKRSQLRCRMLLFWMPLGCLFKDVQ